MLFAQNFIEIKRVVIKNQLREVFFSQLYNLTKYCFVTKERVGNSIWQMVRI